MKTHSCRAGTVLTVAAKPCVSQSRPLLFFFGGDVAQNSLRIYLALIREPMDTGSTKQAIGVRRTGKSDVS